MVQCKDWGSTVPGKRWGQNGGGGWVRKKLSEKNKDVLV